MTNALLSTPGLGGIAVGVVLLVGVVGSIRMLRWIVDDNAGGKGEE